MRNFYTKYLLLAALFLPGIAAAQNSELLDSVRQLSRSRQVPIADRCLAIVDVLTPRSDIDYRLHRVGRHPAFDRLFSPDQEDVILDSINTRCDLLGKDSLLSTELLWVLRPYFDKLYHEDPHYRITMAPQADLSVYTKQKELRKLDSRLQMPAFNLIQINDTLIVNRSLDPLFRKGDMIAAINGVTAREYMKYCYADRYTLPVYVMWYYHYSNVTDHFSIDLVRNGKPMTIEMAGRHLYNTVFNLDIAESTDKNIRTYVDAGCGYIAIPKFFPNNNRLIKVVRQSIMNFKKQGITNIILDLRRNPGGNGHAFDELLSIFIDKPEVEYCRGQKVKVSKQAMQYYDFLKEDMIGQVVDLPDNEIVRSFKSIPKMYIEGIHCYVLISRDTGSIAASMVNMLQYHGAAELVGEPLLHNALKYGEELDGGMLLPTLLREPSVSMVEIDEYTNAVDGVVIPDIPIPYVAADYLTGSDAVLEKLLKSISSK